MLLTGVFAVSNILHAMRMMSLATEENFFISISNVVLDIFGVANAAFVANVLKNGFKEDVSMYMYTWFMFLMVRDVAIMINLAMIVRDFITGVKADSQEPTSDGNERED